MTIKDPDPQVNEDRDRRIAPYEATIDAFQASLRGGLVRPNDAGYDETR